MSSDEVASRLSAKLLQGWCMLDKACDLCNTPIMMDKEKKEFCCGCQIFINVPKKVEKKDRRREKVFNDDVNQRVEGEGNYQGVISERLKGCFEQACGNLLERIVKSDCLDECDQIAKIVQGLSLAYKQFNLK
jgi:uncharacterized Zn finger protein (UPF0148 family)